MDNKIICSINLFDMKQKIYFPDNTFIDASTSILPQELFSASRDKDIKIIHLFGPDDFIDGVIKDFKELETIEYGINNIKFEVN